MSAHDEPDRRDSITEAELEKVIRRATELQFRRREYAAELTRAEVLQIGEEVGLDPAHVQQALSEVKALSLVPDLPPEAELPTFLFGSAIVQVSRVVPGTLAEVSGRLEGFLTTQECLRKVRNQPGRTLWEPSDGFVSKLQRGMNFAGRPYRLAEARSLAVSIESLDEERSMVTLTVDLSNLRVSAAAGSYSGFTAGTVGLSVAAVLAGGLPLLLVAPLALATTLGLGTLAAERAVRQHRKKLVLSLQGLLDSVEHGEKPVSQGAVLLEKISTWLE
ncbi:MAG: hypothetical protein P1V51_00640 [Deltaproteobacteria bacterium]|nr:hypothetical protein [Deltaproteobacteria bacterium]